MLYRAFMPFQFRFLALFPSEPKGCNKNASYTLKEDKTMNFSLFYLNYLDKRPEK